MVWTQVERPDGSWQTPARPDPYIYVFNGSPEGVVTAPTPSLGLQMNGSPGSQVWQKASGAGNTGWVLLSAQVGSGTRAGSFVAGANAFNWIYESASATGAKLAALLYAEQQVATTGSIQGLETAVVLTHPSGTVALALGKIANIELEGAGSATWARSFTGGAGGGGAGTLENYAAFYAQNGWGTAPITNYHAFYVPELTKGVNNYVMKTLGAAIMELGGDLYVGGQAGVHVVASTGQIIVPEAGPASPQFVDANNNGFWTIITGGDKVGISLLGTSVFEAVDNAATPEIGFFGATPVPRPSISVASAAAIITALADLGLIVDAT